MDNYNIDGIKLTAEQLRKAADLYQENCIKDDIDANYVVPADGLGFAVSAFQRALSKSDAYFEAYWSVMDAVCEELGFERVEETEEDE